MQYLIDLLPEMSTEIALIMGLCGLSLAFIVVNYILWKRAAKACQTVKDQRQTITDKDGEISSLHNRIRLMGQTMRHKDKDIMSLEAVERCVQAETPAKEFQRLTDSDYMDITLGSISEEAKIKESQ